MREFGPDWIVAIGGSPIDAAKAMRIKYEYPDCAFEDMRKVFGIPELRRKARFCAVSSTSGAATEVTAFSIITDCEKGIKYPIADFEITPDVAIVDSELAETMSKKLVAHIGMDAITHAIEAYVSAVHCDFTDPLAIRAIGIFTFPLNGIRCQRNEKVRVIPRTPLQIAKDRFGRVVRGGFASRNDSRSKVPPSPASPCAFRDGGTHEKAVLTNSVRTAFALHDVFIKRARRRKIQQHQKRFHVTGAFNALRVLQIRP